MAQKQGYCAPCWKRGYRCYWSDICIKASHWCVRRQSIFILLLLLVVVNNHLNHYIIIIVFFLHHLLIISGDKVKKDRVSNTYNDNPSKGYHTMTVLALMTMASAKSKSCSWWIPIGYVLIVMCNLRKSISPRYVVVVVMRTLIGPVQCCAYLYINILKVFLAGVLLSSFGSHCN